MDQFGIIAYNKRKEKPQVTFLTPRYDAAQLPLDVRRIKERSANSKEKAQSIVSYVRNDKLCRTNQLLHYFGEESDLACGGCDVCVAIKKEERKAERESKLRLQIVNTLQNKGRLSLEKLLSEAGTKSDVFSVGVLREMEDEGLIETSDEGIIKLTN